MLFRMFTLIWLGKCLYEHRQVVPIIPHATAVACLAVVSVMTCVLFYRLIQSDFGTSANSVVANKSNCDDGSSQQLINGSFVSSSSPFLNGNHGIKSSSSFAMSGADKLPKETTNKIN